MCCRLVPHPQLLQALQRTVTRDGPDGTIVAVECTETLAVGREPHVDDLVLGRREEEIALGVEDDLGERTLVSCTLSAHCP